MKKTILYIVLALIIIAIGGYSLTKISKSQEKKIAELENQIQWLKTEIIPIRYKVVERENGKVKLIVKFYNLDNKEIQKVDFTLEGNQPSFDFYVLKFQNGHIALPWRIFTEKIEPQNGIELFSYYEKQGFPQIFFSQQKNNHFYEGIDALYNEIKSGNLSKYNIFGSMVQNTNADIINNRDLDIWQKIVVHTKGGIEIQQE